jgi:hypothetical protein
MQAVCMTELYSNTRSGEMEFIVSWTVSTCQVGVRWSGGRAKLAVQTALIAGSASFYSNFCFMQTLAGSMVTVRQLGIGCGLPAGWY